MGEIEKGDIVKCVALKGFPANTENYMITAGIQVGNKYRVLRAYTYKGIQALKFEGREFVHPSTSFRISE